MRKEVYKHIILKAIVGSIAYNIHSEKSDIDVQGIFLAPDDYIVGIDKEKIRNAQAFRYKPDHDDLFVVSDGIEETDFASHIPYGVEGILWNLSHYFEGVVKCNPSMTELLFVPERFYIWKGISDFHKKIAYLLISNRELFLSKRARFSYGEYAASQLRRIKQHKEYLDGKVPEKPDIRNYLKFYNDNGKSIDYSFDELKKIVLQIGIKVIPGSEQICFWVFSRGKGILDEQGNMLSDYTNNYDKSASIIGVMVFQKTQWKKDNNTYRKYFNWLKNRNRERFKLEKEYGYDCYTDDTEFLTKHGWKKFDEVSQLESLATFNPKTQTIEYQKYINKHEALYTGDMYDVLGYRTDFGVSANHWLYIKQQSKGEQQYDWRFNRIALVPENFYIRTTIVPQTTVYKISVCGLGDVKLEHYMRLMGWYLSEGTCAFYKIKDGSKKLKAIWISQTKSNPTNVGMLTKLSKFINMSSTCTEKEYTHKTGDYNYTEDETTLEYRFFVLDKQLRNKLYEECGHKDDKRIPRWVFSLSKKMKEILIDILLRGDGSKRVNTENVKVFYTSRSGLADDVQELSFLCGFQSWKLGPYDDGMYQVCIDKEAKDKKRLTVHQNLKKRYVEKERIVCFTVPNEILITRRNGYVAIQGNTKHGSHLIRLYLTGRELMETGRLRVHRIEDNDLLRDVRHGKYSYEWLIEQAEQIDKEMEELYCSNKCPLSAKPDMNKVNNLLREILKMSLEQTGFIN